jgi:hypothetical protein
MENQNINPDNIQGQNQGQGQGMYQNNVQNQQYQSYNQNPGYTTNYVAQKNTSTVSIGDWVITIILSSLPLINIILLFVWAFSSSTPVSKANWAKATLIIAAITIILVICFYGVIFAFIAGIVGAAAVAQ